MVKEVSTLLFESSFSAPHPLRQHYQHRLSIVLRTYLILDLGLSFLNHRHNTCKSDVMTAFQHDTPGLLDPFSSSCKWDVTGGLWAEMSQNK